jgi:3-deoxy-manno-octulosonate cytidylyltransferase (CMP-KDO synthetase)
LGFEIQQGGWMSRVLGVIPARYASTRFPGKPLAKINNLEMLAWVIRGSKQSRLLSEVLVATDDKRIVAVAEREGVRAIMTDSDLPSGSDRIWAAVANEDCEIILNIQGDEPLINGALIDQLVQPMLQDKDLAMGTLAHVISYEELHSLNAVKVLVNDKSEAIYFSRFPIPYSRQEVSEKMAIPAVLKEVNKTIGYRWRPATYRSMRWWEPMKWPRDAAKPTLDIADLC